MLTMSTKTLVIAKHDCAPPLTPKLAPWQQRLVERPDIARSWLQSHGSPLHVVVASEFKRNVQDLMPAFESRHLSGGLFFARKANKLPWFVTAAKEAGIGIDIASQKELHETLALGIPPRQVVATAIGKAQELVSEAIGQGCLLIIDNADELALVRAVAQSLGRNARIGLRFSGLQISGRQIFSRFGFPLKDANELLVSIAQDSLCKLDLLHAHLDKYDVEERACAARQLIEIRDNALALGHQITAIDLGGGILVRYLESAGEWENFMKSLIASMPGRYPGYIYPSDGSGFYNAGEDGVTKPDLYPGWNLLSKERFIMAILDHTQKTIPLYQQLRERGIKLCFEPGRALLDNVGITLAAVTFRKRDTLGNLLIGIAMNRSNVNPFRAELCCDPILLTIGFRTPITEGAFLVGALCTEGDIILRRKLNLPFLPEPGDIFCFVNTAGYLAHLGEVGTHGNPLPKNLLVNPDDWSICDLFP